MRVALGLQLRAFSEQKEKEFLARSMGNWGSSEELHSAPFRNSQSIG